MPANPAAGRGRTQTARSLQRHQPCPHLMPAPDLRLLPPGGRQRLSAVNHQSVARGAAAPGSKHPDLRQHSSLLVCHSRSPQCPRGQARGCLLRLQAPPGRRGIAPGRAERRSTLFLPNGTSTCPTTTPTSDVTWEPRWTHRPLSSSPFLQERPPVLILVIG